MPGTTANVRETHRSWLALGWGFYFKSLGETWEAVGRTPCGLAETWEAVGRTPFGLADTSHTSWFEGSHCLVTGLLPGFQILLLGFSFYEQHKVYGTDRNSHHHDVFT